MVNRDYVCGFFGVTSLTRSDDTTHAATNNAGRFYHLRVVITISIIINRSPATECCVTVVSSRHKPFARQGTMATHQRPR